MELVLYLEIVFLSWLVVFSLWWVNQISCRCNFNTAMSLRHRNHLKMANTKDELSKEDIFSKIASAMYSLQQYHWFHNKAWMETLKQLLLQYKKLDSTFSEIWPYKIIQVLRSRRLSEYSADQAASILQECLNAGMDINQSESKYGNTALKLSIIFKEPHLAMFLFKSGAEIIARDLLGVIPLHLAMTNGLHELADALLDEHEKQGISFCWRKMLRLALSNGHQNSAISIIRLEFYLWNPFKQTDFLPQESCFHVAATKGFIKLMKILIVQDPKVLQDEWLVNHQIPSKLSQHKEFIEKLHRHREQPLHLLRMCRYTIIGALRPNPHPKVDKLPLPKTLKQFLVEPEDYFKGV